MLYVNLITIIVNAVQNFVLLFCLTLICTFMGHTGAVLSLNLTCVAVHCGLEQVTFPGVAAPGVMIRK